MNNPTINEVEGIIANIKARYTTKSNKKISELSFDDLEKMHKEISLKFAAFQWNLDSKNIEFAQGEYITRELKLIEDQLHKLAARQ